MARGVDIIHNNMVRHDSPPKHRQRMHLYYNTTDILSKSPLNMDKTWFPTNIIEMLLSNHLNQIEVIATYFQHIFKCNWMIIVNLVFSFNDFCQIRALEGLSAVMKNEP